MSAVPKTLSLAISRRYLILIVSGICRTNSSRSKCLQTRVRILAIMCTLWSHSFTLCVRPTALNPGGKSAHNDQTQHSTGILIAANESVDCADPGSDFSSNSFGISEMFWSFKSGAMAARRLLAYSHALSERVRGSTSKIACNALKFPAELGLPSSIVSLFGSLQSCVRVCGRNSICCQGLWKKTVDILFGYHPRITSSRKSSSLENHIFYNAQNLEFLGIHLVRRF